jgi:hypothetical protein
VADIKLDDTKHYYVLPKTDLSHPQAEGLLCQNQIMDDKQW